MWVVGDWGQDSPWSRDTGVKMVKGEDDVYTGELSLPKGTKFDIKILKSTVSETSGGDNTWSAVRYASTLNTPASHDFGEFTDNLIPNGSFEEGAVKWTPTTGIQPWGAHEGDHALIVGGKDFPNVVTSDRFIIPPNQNLKISLYAFPWSDRGFVLEVRDVATQSALLNETLKPQLHSAWNPLTKTFNTGSSTVTAQLVITDIDKNVGIAFDDIAIVSP